MILDILDVHWSRSARAASETQVVAGLVTLGNEHLLISPDPAQRESALGRLEAWSRQPSLEVDGELALVVQKGRSFQRHHPDVDVLIDRGRYLVIRKPSVPLHVESCFAITEIPESGVIFRSESASPGAAEPWIVEKIASLDAEDLLDRVRILASLPGRLSTSEDFSEAAARCETWFREAGCRPERQLLRMPQGATFNVIAERPGRGAQRGLVVLCAHLDSVNHEDPDGPAPGADDNASGSVAVTAVATALRGLDLTHDVRFVLFGGEEQGLHGSRHFVSQLSQADRSRLRGVVNLDMVASRNTAHPTVLLEGHAISRDLVAQLGTLAGTYTKLAVQTSFSPFASDHVPFIEAGLPGLLTIEGNDSAYPHEHTARDTIDRLDAALFLEITALDLSFVATASGPLVSSNE
jgi:hypothetical protein